MIAVVDAQGEHTCPQELELAASNKALKSRRSLTIWFDPDMPWAAEITISDIGDAAMLPELLRQILPDREAATVTADGAQNTRKCHDAIAERSADAIIRSRKKARL